MASYTSSLPPSEAAAGGAGIDLSDLNLVQLVQTIRNMKLNGSTPEEMNGIVQKLSQTLNLGQEDSEEVINLFGKASISDDNKNTTTTTNNNDDVNRVSTGSHAGNSNNRTQTHETIDRPSSHCPMSVPTSSVTSSSSPSSGTTKDTPPLSVPSLRTKPSCVAMGITSSLRRGRSPLRGSSSPQRSRSRTSTNTTSQGGATSGDPNPSPGNSGFFSRFMTGNNNNNTTTTNNSHNSTRRSRSKTRSQSRTRASGIRSKSPHRSMSPFRNLQARYQDLSSMEDDDHGVGNNSSEKGNDNIENNDSAAGHRPSYTAAPNAASTSPQHHVFHDAHCTVDNMERSDTGPWANGNSQTNATAAFQQRQHQQQQQCSSHRSDGNNYGRPPLSSPPSAPSARTEFQNTTSTSGPKPPSLSPQKRDASSPIHSNHLPKRAETKSDNHSARGSEDTQMNIDIEKIDETLFKFEIGSGNGPSPRKIPSSRGTSNRSMTPRAQQASNVQRETSTTPSIHNQLDSPSILLTPLSDDGTPASTFSIPSPSARYNFSSRLSMSGGSKGSTGVTEMSPLHAVNFAATNSNPFGSPPLNGRPMPPRSHAGFGRRQTAPPNMASGITPTTSITSPAVDMSIDVTSPKTPFFGFNGHSNPAIHPKSVQTSHPKKKDRNSTTPIFEPSASATGESKPSVVFGTDEKPVFHQGIGKINPETQQLLGRLGKATRTRSQSRASFKNTTTNYPPTDIPKVSTDDTSPTASDMTGDSKPSPSSFSVGDMSIDTPFNGKSGQKLNEKTKAPTIVHPNINQEMEQNERSQKTSGTMPPPSIYTFNAGNAAFSVGVGGSKSPSKNRHQKNGSRRVPKPVSRISSGSDASVADKYTNIAAVIEAKRELGKQAYKERDFRKAIEIFTDAITEYQKHFTFTLQKDKLAVLYSNRAAALLSVGANIAAAEDSERAVEYLSVPTIPSNVPGVTILLRPKCYSRRGRAYLKVGQTDDATRAFEKAVGSVDAIIEAIRRSNGSIRIDVSENHQLDEIKTNAVLGIAEASRLAQLVTEINNIMSQLPSMRRHFASKETPGHMENPKLQAGLLALQKINDALVTATDCTELHVIKVKLLASMKRWREVANHCERYASLKVRSDGCFIGDDLKQMAFFRNVPIAKALRSDFFGSSDEDSLEGANLVLSRLGCGEAVLRLPVSVMKIYVRALRLEERYECCIETLKSLSNAGTAYPWHSLEYQKVLRTRSERDSGDKSFRQQEFIRASAIYHNCSQIDFEGESDDFLVDGKNAGGRLHAVLHCNRAACFMAMKDKYNDAIAECNWAIRIHPRYMKAILRKARCYSHLKRWDESIAEFKHYLNLVDEARKNPDYINPLFASCVFDLPNHVSPEDKKRTKEELDAVIKAKADEEEEANRRTHYNNTQHKWKSERFNFKSDAQHRRDYFQSHQSSSRRWDSFNNAGPGRTNSSRQHASSGGGFESQSQQQRNTRGSQSRNSDRASGTPSKDCHYSVLGVPPTATETEIKKTFRKLALKHHPDKGGDPEMFKRISEANQILSDTAARRKYDRERRNGQRH